MNTTNKINSGFIYVQDRMFTNVNIRVYSDWFEPHRGYNAIPARCNVVARMQGIIFVTISSMFPASER